MMDSKIRHSKKDDPAKVAKIGFDAMMRGEGDVVSGWHNKLESAIANMIPARMTAEIHCKIREPESKR